MSQEIQLKRGIGIPASLKEGEPAVDISNGDLYVGLENEEVKKIGGELTYIKEGEGEHSVVVNDLDNNQALGAYSLAEGQRTSASGYASHAEGDNTEASGVRSHAGGSNTKAISNSSVAMGNNSIAGIKGYYYDMQSTTELIIYKNQSHTVKAQVPTSWINGRISLVNGSTYNNIATISSIGSDGSTITITPELPFSSIVVILNPSLEDYSITCLDAPLDGEIDFGLNAIAMGENSKALNKDSFAIGRDNEAIGQYSFAEGKNTTSSGYASHTEGSKTKASGYASHTEGWSTTATGEASHAEGYQTFTGQKGFAIDKANSSSTDKKYKLSAVDGLSVNDVVSIYYGNDTSSLSTIKNFGKITAIDTTNKTITVDTYKNYITRYGYISIIDKPKIGDTVIGGAYTHAEGNNTTASGKYSHVEGNGTKTSGEASHAEGNNTTASGQHSHAEGSGTEAFNYATHAEGWGAIASGAQSHAEGYFTTASGISSHAEGDYTNASGNYSHAEGESTTASGIYSHAEGVETTASGDYSHAGGANTRAISNCSVVMGNNSIAGIKGYYYDIIDATSLRVYKDQERTTEAQVPSSWLNGRISLVNYKKYDNITQISSIDADGSTIRVNPSLPFSSMVVIETLNFDDYSIICLDAPLDGEIDFGVNAVAMGENNKSLNKDSFVTGMNNEVIGQYSFGVGRDNTVGYAGFASGRSNTANVYGHAEGNQVIASGETAHAEGKLTVASAFSAHAEGYDTEATARAAHSEGELTKATGMRAHSEGYKTEASGEESHSEGSETIASGKYAHSEGNKTTASGESTHSEGAWTVAKGLYSHAEGKTSVSNGLGSHAEGCDTVANEKGAHSEGLYTKAGSSFQHVQGKYNIVDSSDVYADIVGNGTSNEARSNAYTLDWDGNAWFAGNITIGSDNDVLITEKKANSLYGATVSINVDPQTYICTCTLKNTNGVILSTSSIDLPLESMVVSGEYNAENKTVILTLKSGDNVEFSIADLVSGLVSQSDIVNSLDSTDITKPLSAAQGKILNDNKANKNELANVATSGSYTDLTDTPISTYNLDEEGTLYISEVASEDLKGDSVFIRYSEYADGTDFTEQWSKRQCYMGVYVGQSAPTDKTSYEWIMFRRDTKPVTVIPTILETNTSYNFGEVAELNLSFPTDAIDGDTIYITFTSGATATNLVIDATNTSDCEIIPDANHGYEICGKFNGTIWIISDFEYTYTTA